MTAISADELVAAVNARRAAEAGGGSVPATARGGLPMWDTYERSAFARVWDALGWLVYVAGRAAIATARAIGRAIRWLVNLRRPPATGPPTRPAYRRRLRLP